MESNFENSAIIPVGGTLSTNILCAYIFISSMLMVLPPPDIVSTHRIEEMSNQSKLRVPLRGELQVTC